MAIIKPGESASPAGGTTDKRISDKIIQLLNKQIKIEGESSQLYLAISQWCKYTGYENSAALFAKYSDEERGHMKQVYEYLQDRDIQPVTPDLSKPFPQTFSSIVDIYKAAYEHEKFVTSSFSNIATACNSEGDFMTLEFAMAFLKEQKEEEAKTKIYVDQLSLLSTDKLSLYLFDKEL